MFRSFEFVFGMNGEELEMEHLRNTQVTHNPLDETENIVMSFELSDFLFSQPNGAEWRPSK